MPASKSAKKVPRNCGNTYKKKISYYVILSRKSPLKLSIMKPQKKNTRLTKGDKTYERKQKLYAYDR